jgi:hypothetical protein
MLTFGFATLVDALSWAVVLTLGVKVIATLVVLIVNKEMRDQPGWGSALWWVTKITPIIAVPSLIWIALLEREAGLAWLFVGTGLFVMIAVPLKIRERRKRIAKRMSAEPRAPVSAL